MQRRCVWFDAPRQVAVRDEPLPELAPDQVLVQTIISAISAGTELLFYRGQVPAGLDVDATIASLAGEVRYPLQYGYACVGRVVETGSQVPGDWLDRAVFAFQPHASHFIARPDEVLPLPSGITPHRAVFLPNMETAVNFLMDGAPLIGECAVVLGQGVVGLLTTALLARLPLTRVLAFDRFGLRREKSLAFGANAAFDPTNARDLAQAKAALGDIGADLIFELSGNPEALNLALELGGFAGRIIIGSWYGRKTAPIDLGGRFHRSRLQLISSQVSTLAPGLTGRWTKARRMAVAWSMLEQAPVDGLMTHSFPVAEAAQAYALLDQRPEQTLQIILNYT
jgi:2-desacetyl-2-hydroxyethyl bacteriochlorophyllide A dehydrogenase